MPSLELDNSQMAFVAVSTIFAVQNVSYPSGLCPKSAPPPHPYVDSLFFRL
jgi:hypothetical protein